MKYIKRNLELIREHLGYPVIRELQSASDVKTLIGGKAVLLFCSNNYLGLSNHPRVIKASLEALNRYGLGAGGSRLLSGNMSVHRELEEAIAKDKHTDACIVFAAGFQTNIGVIDAFVNLFGKDQFGFSKLTTTIFSDEFNHASILDACKLSRAEVIVYKHKDVNDLREKMSRCNSDRKLIVTDGVFSMEGDLTPLDKIVDLACDFDATVMVDDAHGTGVLGKNGGGIVEHFDLHGKVQIIMGTFSKALGAMGGFIAGEKDFVDFLRIGARSYMFSAGISPVIAAGVREGLEVIKTEPDLRSKLWNNTEYFRKVLKENNIYFFNSETPIVPLFIGDEKKCIVATEKLFDRGFFVSCARWPAVPKNASRIRVTISANHTTDQIDSLVVACVDVWQELGLSHLS